MNRLHMKIKAMVLHTALGKKLRYWKQMGAYKVADAEKVAREAYGDKGLTEQQLQDIVADMMKEAKQFNVGFDEYVMYHFENRSSESRREFIPTRERVLYCEKLNRPENQMIFDDKGKTFEVFKKYFKRDLAEVVGWNDKSTEAFKQFVMKHSDFIIKPFNGGNGRGIQIIRGGAQDFDALCKRLKKEYPSGFVAEELIQQVPELSAVHKDSVNTMRIFTIRMDDRVELLPIAWRVGRGGACVDNGGSGGIFCALDDQGVIVSTCDEKGRSYDVHPDTKHPLVGFQIPQYEEAKKLAAELAMVVPSNRYCGWDLALTKDGWIMQEGNWQGGIVAIQCPMQKGCRAQMDAIMQELGL